MADFNRNQVGENGLAKIAEDLSLVRLKSTDTIGSIAQIEGLQAALDGKAASTHTHKYAGSASAGGAATSANKVNNSLKIQLNGGTTENTNLFTFNGSAAKTVNITASGIGAAASSHSHSNLTIQFNGTTKATYNGSAAKTVNITASGIGAAASSHTHAINDITNLQDELDGKAASSHKTCKMSWMEKLRLVTLMQLVLLLVVRI